MGSTFENQSLSKSYLSFTGTDIYLVFQDVIIATAQGISYSITRQKAPIYTMGSPDLRSIARSKRGIAGSLIFTNFDRHALANFMSESEFAAKKKSFETSEGNPMKHVGESQPSLDTTDTIQGTGVNELSSLLEGVARDVRSQSTDLGNAMAEKATPMYVDQLLPFDVSLVGANEYGAGMAMRIYGLEFLNEGSGISVDDVSNEMQFTYMARFISPWTAQKGPNQIEPYA